MLGVRRWAALALIFTAALVFWAFFGAKQPMLGGAEDFGYEPNPDGVEAFLLTLDKPTFAEAGADCIKQSKDIDTFLYRQMNRAHQARYAKPFLVEKQGIGDCVSWGWMHGIYAAQSVDWTLGRLPEPPLIPATESIYGGSRVEARGRKEGTGGWSDGSYGAAAAKWVRDWGVIYRQEYDGGLDLTTYSASRAKDWGNWGNGGQGDNGRLDGVAKNHPAKYVAQVSSFDEAAAAIESGYPVPVASMQGFSSRRDADGFAAPSGSWAHQMVFISVRYAKNGSPRDGLLCLNSWGPSWIGGPVWPEDQPAGSFWVDRATVDSMCRQGDTFAVGTIDGFKWRDLHHGDWLAPLPEELPK